MKNTEKSILISLILCLFTTVFFDTANTARNIRQNTLRLHIIADDNSPTAQDIKIKVKDDLQSVLPELYNNAENYNRAVKTTKENIDYIRQVANNTLKENGAEYTAVCNIEDFYFDTTVYENFTMPRGNYKALTIRLGRRQGKNWWCVAYPGVCVSSRAKYENETSNTFIETDNIRIKFKAVEIWEDIKGILKHKSLNKYHNS